MAPESAKKPDLAKVLDASKLTAAAGGLSKAAIAAEEALKEGAEKAVEKGKGEFSGSGGTSSF